MKAIDLTKLAQVILAPVHEMLKNRAKPSIRTINSFATVVALIASGGNIQAAADALRVDVSTISRRIVACEKDLLSENGDARKKTGPKPIISEKEENELCEFVCCCLPTDIGYDTLYWNAEIVSKVVEFVFEKTVSASTVTRIMRDHALSYKRAEPRNLRRDEQFIANWIAIIAPECLAEDFESGRHPIFLDECTIQSQNNSYSTWGKRGERISLPQGERYKINVIGAIGLFGESNFMTTDSTIDSQVVISFLETLHEKYPETKFSVYADGARYHRSKAVFEFISDKDWIQIRSFPAYAPELNPIELVWADVKNNLLKNVNRLNKERFAQGVSDALCSVAESVRCYEKYWHADELQYIGSAFGIFEERNPRKI